MRLIQVLYFSFLSFILFSSCTTNSGGVSSTEVPSIIPLPATMEFKEGSFDINDETVIVVTNDEEKKLANLLNERLTTASGFTLKILSNAPEDNFIRFKDHNELEEEAYNLKVNKKSIEIESNSFAGRLYALETLRQLLDLDVQNSSGNKVQNWKVPAIYISDYPRYEWRGLMLDVSRHFFEKEYIFKTIDRMAMLKLNTLHLHLVDDQGWRIEIKEYPKLTEIGGWRVDQENKHWNARTKNQPGDESTYGGFYTQEEIKEIVAYAEENAITVVPEIEMPAHVMSAIAAYRELSCHGKEIAVPSGGVWPITDIYCAGKENTFRFLENVLIEVMDLFPSKYIHVGGDEATKTEWEKCLDCRKRMEEEGLENVEVLQSYFIRRMENFLSSHDRVLIGWDEILEGGLAPGATVMSWRGIKGGWEASSQGHDVIMSPGTPLYFNHYQGDPDKEPIAQGGYNTLEMVYHFDPVVDSMTTAQKNHVLGAQANLWSEYIPTESHSEYMLFPRLIALSEILWTPEEKKDWSGFVNRLKDMNRRLDNLDINYSTTMYDVTASATTDSDNSITISLENELPDSKIFYSLDGSNPDENSQFYKNPFLIDKNTILKAVVIEDGKVMGDTLVKNFRFHKGLGAKISYEPEYDKRYTGIGNKTLINILRGSKNFHDGQWLGWLNKDVEIILDLEEIKEISNISLGSMTDQGSGIYFPSKVEFFAGSQENELQKLGEVVHEFQNRGSVELKDFKLDFNSVQVQYIKVVVHRFNQLKDGGAWTFLDEIIID